MGCNKRNKGAINGGGKMRIDELKKKLEIIGEKYNTHFEVEQNNSCTYVKMGTPEDIDILVTLLYKDK